jgi:heme A synthase
MIGETRRAMSLEHLVGNLKEQSALRKFANFALAVLVLNILVILWGAVVRATGSGAGCGSHWPLCNGEVVPLQPEVETLIEFSHRLTSGLAFLGVVGLFLWARKLYPSNSAVRRFAVFSLVFIVIESLIGAGLVLFELVGQNASITRATAVSLHLLNTLILLAFLALTWWRSLFPQTEKPLGGVRFPFAIHWLIFGITVVLVGVSGAIAALGNTLFPSESLLEGIQKDFDQASHFLIRLRVLHPVFALVGAFLVLAVINRMIESDGRLLVRRLGVMVISLGVLQLVAGFVTLVLLAPVWMQLIHLVIADLLWITFVLFLDTKRHSYVSSE